MSAFGRLFLDVDVNVGGRHGQRAVGKEMVEGRRGTAHEGVDMIPDTTVEVGEDADGDGGERGRYGRVLHEASGTEVTNKVARTRDDKHDGHLTPFGLIDNHKTKGEDGNEEEKPIRREGVGALGGGRGPVVDDTVQSRADGETKPNEEGVDDGIDQADRAGDDGARLKLERATEDDISR